MLSLVERGAGLPSEAGNLAVMEPARGRPAGIALGWRATGEAEVRHAPDVQWFKQETSVQGVPVLYVGAP